MSEFQLVEEFQRFLEAREEQDSDYVQREIYLQHANCQNEGLDVHVPLYPLFLHSGITQGYHRFGRLIRDALDCILQVLVDPNHPAGPLMRSFLTIQPEIERILTSRPRGGMLPRVVRPDTVLHDDRIIAHEFNVSWPGGISDSDIIIDNLWANSLYREFVDFAAAHGLVLPQPKPYLSTSLLLEELIEAAEDDNPRIAIVIGTPDIPTFSGDQIPLSARIHDYIESQGHDVDLVHPHDVSYDGSVAHCLGRPIDVMYRIFEWGHIINYHTADYEPILQAYVEGNLPVINSFHSEALSAKSIFELLHCRELRPCFEEMDLDALLHSIPFTINISRVDHPEEILENKDRWVLKRIKGSAGDAVLIGPEADEDAWVRAVRYGLETGSVVLQEYIDSPMMLMTMHPGEGLVQVPRYVDLGPLYFSGRLGNFLARFSAMMMTSAVGVGGGMFPIVAI